MFGFGEKSKMIDPARALPGRDAEIPVAARNVVLGTPMKPPFPEGMEQIVLGMGCFWGAEKIFWQTPGVFTTAVGYAGGHTPIRPTKRCAAGRPGTPRSCSSCSTPP